MDESVPLMIMNIHRVSFLIPLGIASYFLYKRVKLSFLLPLFILLILFIPMEIVMAITSKKGNNLAFANSMFIIMSFFYLFVFYQYFTASRARNFIRLAFALILVSFLAQAVYSPWNLHFQIVNLFSNIIFIAISLYTLLNITIDENKPKITDYSIFWYACGILLYNSTSLIVEFVQNILIQLDQKSTLYMAFSLWMIFGILEYLLFSMAFLNVKKERNVNFG